MVRRKAHRREGIQVGITEGRRGEWGNTGGGGGRNEKERRRKRTHPVSRRWGCSKTPYMVGKWNQSLVTSDR